MIIRANDEKIRYTGRWNILEKFAESTANGNYFEFSFKGEDAVIAFDTSYLRFPCPHIYVSVDNGAKISMPVDNYVRISADCGIHKVMVIMKGSSERHHRWYHPIESKVRLAGIEAEEFLVLPPDNRKKIEFIGDSITEGIAIDQITSNYYCCESSMVYWDDAVADYSWRTAEKLNLRPYIMGYGCLGITGKGAGGVPIVSKSYGYYSDGYEMESINADFIVLNHGTNDRGAEVEDFKKGYYEFLKILRDRNKKAKIISLTPFSGCLSKEIKESVEKYNSDFSDDVFYIDSTGWVSPEPLHPTRNAHKVISEKLSEILKEQFGSELNLN